jgi:hypothetical protein
LRLACTPFAAPVRTPARWPPFVVCHSACLRGLLGLRVFINAELFRTSKRALGNSTHPHGRTQGGCALVGSGQQAARNTHCRTALCERTAGAAVGLWRHHIRAER